MPRFYFDIEDGEAELNRQSTSFPDTDLAREYAIGLAQTIKDRDRVLQRPRLVIIRDDRGQEIGQVGEDDV